MKMLCRPAPVTCLALVSSLAGLVLACNEAKSPTAPPPVSAEAAAVPGGESLAAGGPREPGGAGEPPGLAGEPIFLEEATTGGGCRGPRVPLCHLPDRDGDSDSDSDSDRRTYRLICVADRALPAHDRHGDFPPLTFWRDEDGDGYGSGAPTTGCELPPGSVENGADCDDGDAGVNPDALEICDGIDNNCDGAVDEAGVCDADTVPPEIIVSCPFDGTVVGGSPVEVVGTATDDSGLVAELTVNGVPAPLAGDRFAALVALAPGTNSIVVVALDPSGNSAAASLTVVLSPPSVPPGSPTVTATASPTVGSAPFSVLFDGSATDVDPIVSYEWDFEGDGTFDFSSPSSPITSHTYAAPGCFRATLRVTDATGMTGMDSVGIAAD